MTRVEILNMINSIIAEELGTSVVTEDSTLLDSKLDSFGYAMFWVGLAAKMKEVSGCTLTKEFVEGLDVSTCKVSRIIDAIEEVTK